MRNSPFAGNANHASLITAHGSAACGETMALMTFAVWGDIKYEYIPACRHSPEELNAAFTRVEEAEITVETETGNTHTFCLYDLESLWDFMYLWGVDLNEVAENWEPD